MKGDYEEDHLISLELGGDPKDPKNLWPEPYKTWIPDGGAGYKDKAEKYLNGRVCQGSITLSEAQKLIVADTAADTATLHGHTSIRSAHDHCRPDSLHRHASRAAPRSQHRSY
jgi:hypothetical protein